MRELETENTLLTGQIKTLHQENDQMKNDQTNNDNYEKLLQRLEKLEKSIVPKDELDYVKDMLFLSKVNTMQQIKKNYWILIYSKKILVYFVWLLNIKKN